MSDLYEDYGLEMEPENQVLPQEPTPQKPVARKSGALGRAVALILGFTLGVGGTIGGVAGAGYYVATQPIKDTLNTVNTLSGLNIDFNKYISEDYAKNTVIGLVGKLTDLVGKFTSGKGCLNDLVAVSPYVNTAIDPLLEKVEEFGLSIDKDTFMGTPVSELPNFFMEEMKEMALADILDSVGIEKTPLLNSLCHDAEGNPITIGDIMDGGPEMLLNNVPLEALLISADGVVDPDKDGLIMTLAYGNSNRYEIDGESKVAMKQMVYSLVGGVLYDIDHNPVPNVEPLAGGIFKVTDGDEVYYVGPQTAALFARSVSVSYYAYEDENCTKPLAYKKVMVGDLLGGNASDLFNDLQLGSLFNISPLQDDADPITLALAYGEKDIHYTLEDQNGDGKNDTIVWLGDNQPRTIGTLLKGDLSSILNELKLGTILDVSPLDNYNDVAEDDADPLMLSLAYGEEGTHYNVVEVDGQYEIEWLLNTETNALYSARTIKDLMGNASDIFEEIQLGTVLNVEIDDPEADRMTHALAFGYEGENFTFDVNGNVQWLNGSKPKTVADIMKMGEMLDTLRLATVLGVEIDDPATDGLTHALAFGYEGEHFKFDGDKVVWLEDENGDPYAPKTVSDMSKMGETLNTLRLATVLGVEIDDPEADALTHALAFGYEGENFTFDVNGNVQWLNGSKPKTVDDMTKMGETLNTLRLATVLGVEIDDPTADEMTRALAFGYEGTHYNIVDGNVVWLDDENGDPYAPRTVNDMSKMGKIINDIRLETALSVTHESPRLLHVLAYGSEGDGFNYIKDGSGKVTGIEPLKYNTIASLSSSENNIIDTLKLKDILGAEAVEDDLLLSHLGNATLDTLPDTIATLTFKQVYPEQIYETRYLAADDLTELSYTTTEHFFKGGVPYLGEVIVQFRVDYVENEDGTIKIDPAAWPSEIVGGWVNEDKLAYHKEDGYYHIEGQTDYQVHLKLTSQWKYLLVGEDGETHDYKMTEFAKLVTNMTHNMTNATLRDLNNDGVVALDNATLNTPILTQIGHPLIGSVDISISATPSDPLLGLVLGDLTVTQMLNYTAAVLNAVNSLFGV